MEAPSSTDNTFYWSGRKLETSEKQQKWMMVILHATSQQTILVEFWQLNLSFLVSHVALIILYKATIKTHPRAYQCIWGNYILSAQKCYKFNTLPIWVVYKYMCA